MTLSQRFRKYFSWVASPGLLAQRVESRRPHYYRLCLEPLEERCLFDASPTSRFLDFMPPSTIFAMRRHEAEETHALMNLVNQGAGAAAIEVPAQPRLSEQARNALDRAMAGLHEEALGGWSEDLAAGAVPPNALAAPVAQQAGGSGFSIQHNGVIVGEDGSQGANVFEVFRGGDLSQTSSVDFGTRDGTATVDDNDYVPVSLTLTFNPGEDLKFVEVPAIDDTKFEEPEFFFGRLSNPTNATIVSFEAQAFISNDDPAPGITISDVTALEGNSGTTPFNFTATLSAVSGLTATVDYFTVFGTAIGDYVDTSGRLTFLPGETSKTITVLVNGDTENEPNETFSVVLGELTVQNAVIEDGSGLGTILNDDAPNQNPVAVDDSATVEPDSGPNTIDVLANDSDPDADTLTITSVSQGENGGIVGIAADGLSLTYEPIPDFNGDSFTYEISDGNGGTAMAQVTVPKPLPLMHVDTNRDGTVTIATNDPALDDEAGKDNWTLGPTGRGAIVLPNSDKDNRTTEAPDNWTGGVWGGVNIPANDIVDNPGDIEDLAPLSISKLGALSDNLTIKLEVTKVPGENGYFDAVAAKDRLRIFLPSQVDGNNLILKSGDKAVIGPEAGDKVTFVKNPTQPSEKNYNIFAGNGLVKFGVEGIEIGAFVDITMSVLEGNQLKRQERVRFRVAPFVLLDHTQAVNVDPAAGKTVYIAEEVPLDPPPRQTDFHLNNRQLRDAMRNHFGAHLDVVPRPTQQGIGRDPWHQDGYEIGYVKAPYGSMHMVLELPRARDVRPDGLSQLQGYIEKNLLRINVGVNRRIEGAPKSPESGGNIESLPIPGKPPGYPGLFFHGENMKPFQTNFFDAQAINTNVGGATGWLLVGHVDEAVAVGQNGTVIVADPESAWALVIWAAGRKRNALMLDKMNELSSGIRVGDLLTDNARRLYNFQNVMDSSALPRLRGQVEQITGTAPPESPPVWTGPKRDKPAVLAKGGALVGFFPNNNKREYRIEFHNATHYQLSWRELPGGRFQNGGQGTIQEDVVFPDALAFVHRHFWTGGAPARGDVFTFTADPQAKTIEMPVLFEQGAGGAARAFTTNHVNSLYDGQTVITGLPFGPIARYNQAGNNDIFADYAKAMFGKAGYSNVIMADARVYHNSCGSIHCGTNVQRVIPTFKWWEK